MVGVGRKRCTSEDHVVGGSKDTLWNEYKVLGCTMVMVRTWGSGAHGNQWRASTWNLASSSLIQQA